ncbi:hypothetical protein CDL12_17170 [Handroanthus impetiginosus]|uniref:Putative plant transposon protein domain-containing protein n=1 Tax=Handroanthus impetiginosus TaxID=429701 RepID=A0A2G9GYB4_9LAMI|nr:hypothetical protein CDL12_17170 [Handroanthus impetiginosus]
MVQGITIDFSSFAINHLFSTPTVDEPNDFEASIQSPPSLETISKTICKVPPPKLDPKCIPRSSLINEAWDWLHFINAQLYPSSDLSEVSKDGVVLLYAILIGVPLDIGHYIHNAILKSARGGMSFPSLITVLCQQEGLENLSRDELIKPNTTINEEN